MAQYAERRSRFMPERWVSHAGNEQPGNEPPLPSHPKLHTDFRSIYATVLEKWLGIPSEPVLGQKWPLIDCIA